MLLPVGRLSLGTKNDEASHASGLRSLRQFRSHSHRGRPIRDSELHCPRDGTTARRPRQAETHAGNSAYREKTLAALNALTSEQGTGATTVKEPFDEALKLLSGDEISILSEDELNLVM